MIRLIKFLIFGYMDCAHVWIIHKELEYKIIDPEKGSIQIVNLFVQKCKNCGEIKHYEVRQTGDVKRPEKYHQMHEAGFWGHL